MYALLNALGGLAPGGQGIPGQSPGGRGYWPKSHPNYSPYFNSPEYQKTLETPTRSGVALPLMAAPAKELEVNSDSKPLDLSINRAPTKGPFGVPATQQPAPGRLMNQTILDSQGGMTPRQPQKSVPPLIKSLYGK